MIVPLQSATGQTIHVDKEYLPSRTRRGRRSTTPVWIVRWDKSAKEFKLKRDAVKFAIELVVNRGAT